MNKEVSQSEQVQRARPPHGDLAAPGHLVAEEARGRERRGARLPRSARMTRTVVNLARRSAGALPWLGDRRSRSLLSARD